MSETQEQLEARQREERADLAARHAEEQHALTEQIAAEEEARRAEEMRSVEHPPEEHDG